MTQGFSLAAVLLLAVAPLSAAHAFEDTAPVTDFGKGQSFKVTTNIDIPASTEWSDFDDLPVFFEDDDRLVFFQDQERAQSDKSSKHRDHNPGNLRLHDLNLTADYCILVAGKSHSLGQIESSHPSLQVERERVWSEPSWNGRQIQYHTEFEFKRDEEGQDQKDNADKVKVRALECFGLSGREMTLGDVRNVLRDHFEIVPPAPKT